MGYPERIVPSETSPGILALHLKRYEFALPWAEGTDVLDAGCGVGYGTAYLARFARKVVGIDWSSGALEHAREHYSEPNVEYIHADLADLPLDDASFDVVCAFETIEHLDAHAFLRTATRLLRPNGTLLVSTPRAEQTTGAPENPFHQVELSASDFERILRDHFAEVELYGQRRLQTRRHRLVQRLDVLGLRRRLPFLRPAARLLGTAPMADVTLDEIVIARGDLGRASELVAVCAGPRRE